MCVALLSVVACSCCRTKWAHSHSTNSIHTVVTRHSNTAIDHASTTLGRPTHIHMQIKYMYNLIISVQSLPFPPFHNLPRCHPEELVWGARTCFITAFCTLTEVSETRLITPTLTLLL